MEYMNGSFLEIEAQSRAALVQRAANDEVRRQVRDYKRNQARSGRKSSSRLADKAVGYDPIASVASMGVVAVVFGVVFDIVIS